MVEIRVLTLEVRESRCSIEPILCPAQNRNVLLLGTRALAAGTAGHLPASRTRSRFCWGVGPPPPRTFALAELLTGGGLPLRGPGDRPVPGGCSLGRDRRTDHHADQQ